MSRGVKKLQEGDFYQLIREIFKVKEVPPMILSQIAKYKREHGYSYLEMARALLFFVEVQKGKIDSRYGIAIIPLIMQEATSYVARQQRKREEILASARKPIKKRVLKPQYMKEKNKKPFSGRQKN